MNYYIFGDSFGFPERGQPHPNYLWYDRINGTVINDCLGCTGVKRNLKKLEERKPVDANIIFLLSNKHRLTWPFVKQREHNEDCYQSLEGPVHEGCEYLLEYEKEIRLVYDMFGDDVEKSLFNTILYLYFWSKKYNCKTLIFDCDDADGNLFEEDFYFFNNSTFKVHEINLMDVCAKEFDNSIISPEIDNRCNHLTPENHEVVYNIVSNFFTGTNYSETFHEGLLKGGEEEFNRFIYE